VTDRTEAVDAWEALYRAQVTVLRRLRTVFPDDDISVSEYDVLFNLSRAPGHAARIFRAVADAEINIDMVLQNISHASDRRTDITFTLPHADGPRAVKTLGEIKEQVGFAEVIYDPEVGKVSLVGAGLRNHPGVTATFCEALSKAGVNIETMNTSEIRISVICRVNQLDVAVRALHDAFELGGDEQAVVHAGTGR